MISVHNSNFVVGLVCGITAVTFGAESQPVQVLLGEGRHGPA